MRKLAIALILLSLCVAGHAQRKAIDSLDKRIAGATTDTQRVNLKLAKFKLLSSGNLDAALSFGRAVLAEAKHISYAKGEIQARVTLAGDYAFSGNYAAAKSYLDSAALVLNVLKDTLLYGKLYDHYGTMNAMQNKYGLAHSFYARGISLLALKKYAAEELGTLYQNNAIAYQQESDYPHALANYQQALYLAEQTKDVEGTAYIYLNIGITYNSLSENARAAASLLQAIAIAKKLELKNVLTYAYANIASVYADLKKPEQQYEFAIKAATLGAEIGDKGIQAASLSRAASALVHEKKFAEAMVLAKQAVTLADSSKQPYNIFQTYTGLGFVLKSQNNYAAAIPYYEKGFALLAAADLYDPEVGFTYGDLSECYEKTGNLAKALATYKTAAKITDSVKGKENIKNATELRMNYEFDKKQELEKNAQLKKDIENRREKNEQYFVISFLGIVILAIALIVFIQFRNNRQKQRAYDLLKLQKKETDEQRQKTESALSELQLTQEQLIQSAKMASLGELTAGIAHEIQNPLNFVNNFSEVSVELVGELDEELAKGDIAEARLIAGDVKQNLEKINHHGKRADSIVKGMLEHSRTSGGEKQPVDINKLAEEYLRLAYHGIRAKDKSFNAELVTDLDNQVPLVNVLPQDIGRVLINLFSNAFYAVDEKKKSSPTTFHPVISVSTYAQNGYAVIRIKDNGTGIPEQIREKIMQPFFTTKPTGEGTGLGLSLSYDIVVKGHGGKIEMMSQVGEGTEFVVSLPLASV